MWNSRPLIAKPASISKSYLTALEILKWFTYLSQILKIIFSFVEVVPFVDNMMPSQSSPFKSPYFLLTPLPLSSSLTTHCVLWMVSASTWLWIRHWSHENPTSGCTPKEGFSPPRQLSTASRSSVRDRPWRAAHPWWNFGCLTLFWVCAGIHHSYREFMSVLNVSCPEDSHWQPSSHSLTPFLLYSVLCIVDLRCIGRCNVKKDARFLT